MDPVPTIAWVPHRKIRGVNPPTDGQTSDWREPYGPANTRNVEAFETMPLDDALHRTWNCEALLTSYRLLDAEGTPVLHQPRINKLSLPWIESLGFRLVLAYLTVEFDTPGHQPWEPETLLDAQSLFGEPILRTAHKYLTPRGWRAVQPLAEWVPIEDAEAYLWQYLTDLRKAGLQPDENCKDWTRLMRMPNIVRDGERTGFLPFHRSAKPILAPEPSKLLKTLRAKKTTEAEWTRATKLAFAQGLTPDLADLAAQIGALLPSDATNTHGMFLALGGALCRSGHVPPESLPRFLHDTACVRWPTRAREHLRGGMDTARRAVSALPIAGLAELWRQWPKVAHVVARTTAKGRERALWWAVSEHAGTPTLTPDGAKFAMENAIRNAPLGVTVIAVTCGGGKSTAARRVAVERVLAAGVTPSGRAPMHSKTAISFDKNRLARQIHLKILDDGFEGVKRIFSPASHTDAHGRPGCFYVRSARAMASGGQSVRHEMCEGRKRNPCPHQAGCLAYPGFEGDAKGPILLSSHGKLVEAHHEAGTTGIVVIDEPPHFLETITLSLAAIERTIGLYNCFVDSYTAAMTPLVVALVAYVRQHAETGSKGFPGPPIDLRDAIVTAGDAIDYTELLAACDGARRSLDPSAAMGDVAFLCAREALSPDARTSSPPLKQIAASRCRQEDDAYAKILGEASHVLHTLWTAVATDLRVVLRVSEPVRGDRTLHLTLPRLDFATVLRRDGACVVMDANADIHLPVLTTILGIEPPVVRIDVADGVPIERTLIMRHRATRSRWFGLKRVDWSSDLVACMQEVVDFANDDVRSQKLCLITFRPLERMLRWVLEHAQRPVIEEEWVAQGFAVADLHLASKYLAPALRPWKGTWTLGYYGGVRGMDDAMDCDVLVTLGDPYANLGDTQNDAEYLGLDAEAWHKARSRAELEQAHGRLRAPRRTTPARAAHIGMLVPSGLAWTDGTPYVRAPHVRQERPMASLTGQDIRTMRESAGWTQEQMAEALDLTRLTIHRWETEKTTPSSAESAVLLQMMYERFALPEEERYFVVPTRREM